MTTQKETETKMPIDQPPQIQWFQQLPAQSVLATFNTNFTTLSIACGKGQVAIDTKTGKVTLTNCTLDEGAQAFWEAVERIVPASRQ